MKSKVLLTLDILLLTVQFVNCMFPDFYIPTIRFLKYDFINIVKGALNSVMIIYCISIK